MTPEAKKRYEELAKINAPTDLNFQCDDWKCCAKQSFNLGFHSGYQAGMQDPDANKELLDSMRYQARVDLFDSIFKNLDEFGFEDTLAWMRSRHQFESNKLKAARGDRG